MNRIILSAGFIVCSALLLCQPSYSLSATNLSGSTTSQTASAAQNPSGSVAGTELPGGMLSVKSASCGAVGDGSSDDTNAIQKCIDFAQTHHLNVYFPTSRGCYLVTHSLNLTGVSQLWLLGDGRSGDGIRSTICHALVEPYPLLDFTGATYAGIDGLNIVPRGEDFSKSRATAGVLFQPINGNDSYNAIKNSVIAAGNASTEAAVVDNGADQTYVGSSVFISGAGAGYITGNGLGTATAVKSKFQSARPVENVTYGTIFNTTIDSFGASTVPPLQITGSSGGYNLSGGNYICTCSPQATAPYIIEVSNTAGVHISETRTETHVPASFPQTALYIAQDNGGDVIGDGSTFITSANPRSWVLGGPSIFSATIELTENCLSNTVGGFLHFGLITNSTLTLSVGGCNQGHFGTVTRGFRNNRVTYQGPDSLAAIFADLPAPAYVLASTVCIGSDASGACQNTPDLNHGSFFGQTAALSAIPLNSPAFDIQYATVSGNPQGIVAVASAFNCTRNPEISFYDCGSSLSLSSCHQGALLARVTLTAANTAFAGGATGTFKAGDAVAFAFNAGACTSLQVQSVIVNY